MPHETPTWAEKLTAGATIVAAVYIPFSIEDAAKTTRTAEAVNDIARILEKTVAEKETKDHEKGKKGPDVFSYDYISGDENVEGLVFKILNEYEYLCAGANLGIFREDVIMRIRGDALMQTWRDYDGYITKHRAARSQNSRAWNECPPVIERASGSSRK